MSAATAAPDAVLPKLPESFPPNTLFVAVCDDIRTYAGEDGGPQHGGKGRWRVGDVGPWTSQRPVPLAFRDPDDGTIWRGWVEVVQETRVNERGQRVSAKSQHLFAEAPEPSEPGQRKKLRTRKKASGKATWPKLVEPSDEAMERAAHGAKNFADALLPGNQADLKRQILAREGVPG